MLDKLESNFKQTLNDFKVMMEKNNENKNEPNIIIQNNGMSDDYNNWKKKEILRLNKELEDKKNEIDLEEKNYLNQIEELENSIKIINIEITQNKKYKEDEEFVKNFVSGFEKRNNEYNHNFDKNENNKDKINSNNIGNNDNKEFNKNNIQNNKPKNLNMTIKNTNEDNINETKFMNNGAKNPPILINK